jgi:hypothetical protein
VSAHERAAPRTLCANVIASAIASDLGGRSGETKQAAATSAQPACVWIPGSPPESRAEAAFLGSEQTVKWHPLLIPLMRAVRQLVTQMSCMFILDSVQDDPKIVLGKNSCDTRDVRGARRR